MTLSRKPLIGFGCICIALGIVIGIGIVYFTPNEPAQASNVWDMYHDLSTPSQNIIMSKLNSCLGKFGGIVESDRTHCITIAEYNIQYFSIIETGKAQTDLRQFVLDNQP